MTVLGTLATDNSIEIEADECAVTGRPVLGNHSALQYIGGTRRFYRYLTDFEHLLTEERRAALITEAKGGESPAQESFSVKRGNRREPDNTDPQS